jgi:signal transduction histidine kinase
MNNAANKDSSILAQTIRWHLIQLFLLLITFGLVGIGYSVWSNAFLAEANEKANEFHLSAYSHLVLALNELHHIQGHTNLDTIRKFTDEYEGLKNQLLDLGYKYDSQSSFYILRDEIRKALQLHERYPDQRFDVIVSKLRKYLLQYENYSGDFIVKGIHTDLGINTLYEIRQPLEQLAVMHLAARDDLQYQLEYDKERQTVVFLVLIVLLLLTGIYIVRHSYKAITAVIEEINRSDEMLRRSQKMEAVGQLAGGIAHDFNNLLAGILGNVELIEMHIDADDQTKHRLNTIKRSIDRAADHTKQLLAFSRTEKSSQVKPVNLNALITDMQSLVEHSLTPQITVIHHLADDLWTTEIDTGDFADAYLNMVLNARDAMHDRGDLTIETRNVELDQSYADQNPGVDPGTYVQFSVTDNGEGISHDQVEQIFEPFFTTKAPGKGTGLGLAMVFGFVRRSSGHIKVYSEPGIGTSFHMYLPSSDMSARRELTISRASPVPCGTETILAVDDEIELLSLTHDFLVGQGFRVLTAGNAEEAMQQLQQDTDIRLLFTDVVMPGEMNGYELAEAACKIRPDLKVLLTSGYTSRAMAKNGQARFNADLLSKPYTLLKLSQRIREILDY